MSKRKMLEKNEKRGKNKQEDRRRRLRTGMKGKKK